MKKLLIILLMLLFAVPALGVINVFTRSIDNKRTYKNSYRWTNKPKDLLLDWAQEVEDRLDGTTSNQSYFLDPTATAPDANEGRFYYDSGANAIKLHTGSVYVTLATAAGNSLDASYDAGNTITVDGTAVTLTATEGGNTVVLAIVQDDTASAVAQTITSAGTGALLTFTSNGSGLDMLGTSSSWQVTKAGVATYLGVIVGASDLVFSEFSESILNDTNNEFQFTGNEADVEDFSIGLGANDNKITFSSDSSADTIDFGDINTLMGMTAITGDQATLTISINANSGGEDLIIHQDGTQDAGIQLLSDGTGADAIDIEATAGGIYIETTGATKDIKLDATGGSVYIDSGEATDDAIVLITTGTNGGIDITSLADIDITTTGDPGEDITLTNTGGSIILTATESAVDAILIEATLGGIDILASGATAGEDIDIIATGSSINITSTENDQGAIDIETNGGITERIRLYANQGTGVAAQGESDASIQLLSDDGGISLLSNANLVDAVRIEAGGGVTATMTINNQLGTNAAAITISTTAAGGDLNLDSKLGRIEIEAEENVANAIFIIADGGSSTTLKIHSETGTSATDGATSLQITSTLGGIELLSGLGAANAIRLNASGIVTGFAVVLETTNGGIQLNADHADNGDITIDAADILTFTSVDTKIFDGANTETWIIEGSVNGFETTIVFTDPTADGTMTFPDLGDEGAAGGEIAWIADAGTATKDGTDAALPVTDALVLGTSTTNSAWSLPNGEEGQILTVVIVVDGGEAIITPDTTNASWATVILTDDIDSVTFMYIDDSIGWMIIGTGAAAGQAVAITQ